MPILVVKPEDTQSGDVIIGQNMLPTQTRPIIGSALVGDVFHEPGMDNFPCQNVTIEGYGWWEGYEAQELAPLVTIFRPQVCEDGTVI